MIRSFALAPIETGPGPGGVFPVVSPVVTVGGGSGTTAGDAGLLDQAKAVVARFRAALADLVAAPAIVAEDTARIQALRIAANDSLTGQDRALTLSRLDQLAQHNVAVTSHVQASAGLAASGQAKIAELADALGIQGFGFAPLIAAAVIAALAGLTFAIGQVLETVTVHRKEVDTEAAKLQAVLGGQLPAELLQPASSGGGGLDLLGDVRTLLPLALALILLPSILGALRK